MTQNAVSLSDVIGNRHIKETFLNTYQNKVMSFLFIGAIHNGKHYLSKAVANSLDLPLIVFDGLDISNDQNELRQSLLTLYKKIKDMKQAVLLIDGAENIFKVNKVSDEMISDYLNFINDLNHGDYKVRVILNCDVPAYLDKRMILSDTIINRFKLPEVFERLEFIKRVVGEDFYYENKEVLDYIGKESNYYAFGDLEKYMHKLISLNCKLTLENINFKKGEIKLFDEYGYEFIEELTTEKR